MFTFIFEVTSLKSSKQGWSCINILHKINSHDNGNDSKNNTVLEITM